MTDPFADYFRGDYISSAEWAVEYGMNSPSVFVIESFNMRDTRDFQQKRDVPKPVVKFLELGRVVFINKQSHLNLSTRFGPGYASTERRREVWRQRVEVTCVKGHSDKPQIIVTSRGLPDQHAAIGDRGDKFLEWLKSGKLETSDFMRWLVAIDVELHTHLSSIDRVQEWPVLAIDRMSIYASEINRGAPT